MRQFGKKISHFFSERKLLHKFRMLLTKITQKTMFKSFFFSATVFNSIRISFHTNTLFPPWYQARNTGLNARCRRTALVHTLLQGSSQRRSVRNPYGKRSTKTSFKTDGSVGLSSGRIFCLSENACFLLESAAKAGFF